MAGTGIHNIVGGSVGTYTQGQARWKCEKLSAYNIHNVNHDIGMYICIQYEYCTEIKVKTTTKQRQIIYKCIYQNVNTQYTIILYFS